MAASRVTPSRPAISPWHFLCLDVDVSNPGDCRTATVGEIPVIVTRDENGSIHAMVNRCAHKGALVCLKKSDNVKKLTCVYHAWTYNLAGQLGFGGGNPR